MALQITKHTFTYLYLVPLHNLQCHLCVRSFSLKNSLLRHYRTSHPGAHVGQTTVDISSKSSVTSSNKLPVLSNDSREYANERCSGGRSVSVSGGSEPCGADDDASDGGDLIQNLLGIHDSKMLDEILGSADSAARLLGVGKDALTAKE